MIAGVVTADREAMIRLAVLGAADGEQAIEAIIDTGFDGWLSLPPSLMPQLGLPWRRRGRALLADGSEGIFDIYEATIIWDGQPRRLAVDEAATAPLVGMSLMEGYQLTIQVRSSGHVTLTTLP